MQHAIQCDAYKAVDADVPWQGEIARPKPLYPLFTLLFENGLSPWILLN